MPPQAGLTPQVRAAKKFHKGSIDFQKGQLMRITHGLRGRMDVLGQVDTFLVGLGVLEPLRLEDMTVPKKEVTVAAASGTASDKRLPFVAGIVPMQSDVKVEEGLDPVDASVGLAADLASNARPVLQPWDRNWTYVGKLGPTFLEVIVNFGYPHIFTQMNMKALKRPGAKTVLFKRLLQYVEFLTNWDAQFFIEVAYRSQDAFANEFVAETVHLGNRGQHLVLEPNEDDQWIAGIYGYEKKGEGKVSVWHCFEMNCVRVLTVPKDVGELHITHNYSEAKATLKSKSTSFSKQLALVFADQIANRPVKKGIKVKSTKAEKSSSSCRAVGFAQPVGSPKEPDDAPKKDAVSPAATAAKSTPAAMRVCSKRPHQRMPPPPPPKRVKSQVG